MLVPRPRLTVRSCVGALSCSIYRFEALSATSQSAPGTLTAEPMLMLMLMLMLTGLLVHFQRGASPTVTV